MAGYIGAAPVPQATQHRQAFTATAAQTSFATAGYTSQFIDVYLNGIKLAGEDYTATNGSDIVLAIGAAAGDILEYVAYTPFEVANQTFTGTTTTDVLTVTGAFTSKGIDDNAAATAMTLDAAGNILVGKATTGLPIGVEFRQSGTMVAGATSAAALVLNRATTQGEMIDIKSDNVTVGAIGTQLIRPFFASNDGVSGCGVLMGGSSVLPTDRFGNPNDALTNLGSVTSQFNDLYMAGSQHVGGAINVTGGVVTGNLIGAIVATSRVSGGYGTGNSASAAVTSASEARTYIVYGSRHTSSTNVTNIMAQVTYATSSRTIVTINTGTSLTVTESGGVISVNNTGTAASVYMTLTRVY